MFSHIDEFNTFNGIEQLNRHIKNQEQKIETQTKEIEIKHTITKKRKKAVDKSFMTFSNQNDILLAIQNNDKFLKLISYIRKPNAPSMFMYIENETDIVFIVNSATNYPITIIKFPIKAPHFYINDQINYICIEFPYRIINEYISKQDKTNFVYSLILKKDNNENLVMEYRGNEQITYSTKNISNINKQDTLNEIFTGKILSNELFIDDVNKNYNHIDDLNKMKLLLLVESKDLSSFIKFDKFGQAKQELVITENLIKLNTSLLKQQNSIIIADANMLTLVTNPILYWNKEQLEPTKLNFIQYASLFKSAEKLSVNNCVYYGICKWREYPKTKTYWFVKVIISNSIKKKMELFDSCDEITFGSIFNNYETIIDYALCYSV